MGQRSTGSVTLCFGLISIPVKLYLTASSESVSFKQISPDGNLIKQQVIDGVTGVVLDRATLQKGYEHAKGQYVIFSKDEVTALASSKCDTATIEEFVPLNTVDPLHIEKTLYVGPDKGADKAYRLLSAALKKKNAGAVAKYYTRGREHLIVVAERDGGLVFHQMFYATEIRSFDNPCAKLPISDQELDLASKLIQQSMVESYGNAEEKPELYRDNFIDRVNEAVQVKLAGGTVTVEKADKPTPGGDLASILQASLNAFTPSTPPAPAVEKSKKTSRKKKAS